VKILFRNVSHLTTARELQEFAGRVIAPRWYLPFAPSGRIRNCSVVKIKDLDNGEVEFHGILDIHPVKAAHWVMRKLNHETFHRRSVEVRKWHSRSSLNERRVGFRSGSVAVVQDRRRGDRRRPNLETDLFAPLKSEIARTFQRLYGS
jgi:hypothetical protein